MLAGQPTPALSGEHYERREHRLPGVRARRSTQVGTGVLVMRRTLRTGTSAIAADWAMRHTPAGGAGMAAQIATIVMFLSPVTRRMSAGSLVTMVI
jgi:hypothetical protein